MEKFIVETSARHLHVSQADLETLFGKGASLSNKKDLSQPGQFATNEKVTVVGPRGQLTMSILGPVRPETQIEVSLSDARTLGVTAPIRESGDIEGSAPCKLIGPAGEIELTKGVIVAKRHIHMTCGDATKLNVKDKDIVWVKIETPDRKTVFGDVVVRVSDKFALAMHLDTDEANAAQCAGVVYGEIIKL
ncbi:phosphate propanoyltransferase [Paludicola sp. MB14-C6]|uniref:phosphate propanoyltransferase n=1 Tax=Paludihabitans sp. MB14-C6 TaxID=3070656 RepID=UPI0027DCBB30|nr:phosphate propanoyltransferase [Paludicola sp. MB14-C6]WMJ22011.1 phosphate propanoyltransferase [Paludicola sp. MB14-C6]